MCSDAGLKPVEREQYFYTLEIEERQQMQHLCREYTLLRNENWTRVRGWIRSNTRIGPVLNIPFAWKPIRTISEVFGIFSRFEFDFCRCGNYFFERFEFLVCSKFNQTQCGRTCACAVACLCPHNSITNVVVFVTIHDDTDVHVNIFRDVAKNMKPLWKVVQIVRYVCVLVACLCLCSALNVKVVSNSNKRE